LPITVSSQTVSGKVYDDETTVSGVEINNVTKKIMTLTDDDGNFKIKASINDTLVFKSHFHLPQPLIVNQNHFEDVIVIELKTIVNELDKVYVEKMNAKEFEAMEVENTMIKQLKSDMELQPYLYEPPPILNMDFKAIGALIAKLFKNKNKSEPITMANYYDLKALFESDPYFNSEFLISELKIERQYHPLFIDFCEAKGIEKRLLLKENKFLLIEILIKYSDEFLEDNKD